jgi:hypothetical protein
VYNKLEKDFDLGALGMIWELWKFIQKLKELDVNTMGTFGKLCGNTKIQKNKITNTKSMS